MTWWQTLLIACIPVTVGLIPTVYLLRTARKKAIKEITTEDAIAAKTYMEAAQGMAAQNKELRMEIEVLQKRVTELEKRDVSRAAELVEIERGVGILCDQMARHEPPIIPEWTLKNRVYHRLTK